MFVAEASREEFLGIAQGEKVRLHGARENVRLKQRLLKQGMLLLWDTSPDEVPFPSVVVVNEEDIKDFLAWVGTYLQTFKPFTAFCRVSNIETATRLTERKIPKIRWELQLALLGLVLSETAAYVGESGKGKMMTLKACTATCSYAASKMLWVGGDVVELERAIHGWQAARELTLQQQLQIPLRDLLAVWSVIWRLAQRDSGAFSAVGEIAQVRPAIIDICMQLYETGTASPWMLERSGIQLPLGEGQAWTRQTREERVVLLDSIFQRLPSIDDPITASFIAGYMLSQVAPGTIDHVGLLKRLGRSYPAAYLWYGLCAGLQRPNSLIDYSEGLGRRVLQEATRHENFLDKPKCDISIEELSLLRSAPSDHFDFKVANSAYLDVEIAPCVVSSLKTSNREVVPEVLFDEKLIQRPEFLDVLAELDDALYRVSRIRERMSRLLGAQPNRSRKR
jgi:hypothetical protein